MRECRSQTGFRGLQTRERHLHSRRCQVQTTARSLQPRRRWVQTFGRHSRTRVSCLQTRKRRLQTRRCRPLFVYGIYIREFGADRRRILTLVSEKISRSRKFLDRNSRGVIGGSESLIRRWSNAGRTARNVSRTSRVVTRIGKCAIERRNIVTRTGEKPSDQARGAIDSGKNRASNRGPVLLNGAGATGNAKPVARTGKTVSDQTRGAIDRRKNRASSNGVVTATPREVTRKARAVTRSPKRVTRKVRSVSCNRKTAARTGKIVTRSRGIATCNPCTGLARPGL